MKRAVDSGTGVAAAAAKLVLTGAVTTTLAVFAQAPKAYAQSGCSIYIHAPRTSQAARAAVVRTQASQVGVTAVQGQIRSVRDSIQRKAVGRRPSG